MKIQDIFRGKKEEINFTITPSIKTETFKKLKDVEVRITFSQDAFWLVHEEDRIEIEGVTVKDNSDLEKVAQSNCITYLVETKENKADIKAKLLVDIISVVNIEFGLTDIIIDGINKRYSRKRGQLKHTDWLKEELIIQDIKSDDKKILIDNSLEEKVFRIFGKTIAIDVKRNKDDKFEIVKILNWNNRFNPTYLLKGEISIKDVSETAKIRQDVELKLNRIDSNERYISTWEKYQEKEKEFAVEEVKKRGFLIIKDIKQIDDTKYKLIYKINKNTENWLNIEAGTYIDLYPKPEFPMFDSYEKDNKKRIVVEIIEKKDGYLIVEQKGKIPVDRSSNYYASLSLSGIVKMNERRNDALKEIRNNAVPMPALSAVLEGIEYDSVTRRKIKPLTAKVKREFGNFGPNAMQELALDIALNTPDIAIIQGPPGTGKTKIISALSKRLSELYKERGETPEMNILLTAFQHDAVENMISRTEVLGLPALKFAEKQNQSIDIIEKWIKKQSEKIEAIQNGIEPNATELIYNDIVAAYLSYLKTLDHEDANNYLLKLRKDKITELPDNLIDSISEMSGRDTPINEIVKNKIIDNIENIRTDVISYEDDGKYNLKRFLKNYERYKDDLPEIDNALVENLNIYLKKDALSKEELQQINEIKLNLLDKLKSVDISKTIKLPNARIENIFKELIDYFSKQIQSCGSVYSVLSEFINDLNSNKERVKKAIQNYVAIAAATVQGSKARSLTEVKPDPFDTVIVDEAARANPLDLLIPLTSAERRIVLVGDHRQLPHIVDKAIQKELEEDEGAAKDVTKYLKDSLFERFYNILKKLEQKDGIKRVVTLNTQYRMHPVLGDFISRTFYEKYGDPKIEPGVSAELLEHNIDKYKGKVVVSVNVPYIKEGEKKQNGSTFRPVEAEEAIRRAKEILDSDTSLSVGVITFYSKQVNELFLAAEKKGLVEIDDSGTYSISKHYLKTIIGDERFRIGSVDAFQGKEFDVVILSLVRSNQIKIKTFKDVRRKYGFLTSYNRLNVAMSRAKKLLIIIGDEEMFKTKHAKDYTYGLYAFYNELIGSDYGTSI